jgi:DNA-binding CsgD family transcriptional regulator
LGGYEARRRLRRADDGTTVERTIWVRALPPEGGRRLAVVVAGEARDDGPIDLPGTDIDDSVVRRAAPVAVGTVDAEWRIARISADVEPILGRKPEDSVGLPVLAAVHPADVAGLLAVVDQASNTRRAVMIRLRVLDGSQRWVPVDVVLTPLEGGAHVPRFGFALAAAASSMSRPGTQERIAALEQTLWRIAQELQSAGVVQGLERMPDVLALPALRDLTARQWEILTRLLRGERVPGIARAMYLSPSTIRNHLSAIFRKVGVHSQEQLLEVLKAEADGSVATAAAGAGAGAR